MGLLVLAEISVSPVSPGATESWTWQSLGQGSSVTDTADFLPISSFPSFLREPTLCSGRNLHRKLGLSSSPRWWPMIVLNQVFPLLVIGLGQHSDQKDLGEVWEWVWGLHLLSALKMGLWVLSSAALAAILCPRGNKPEEKKNHTLKMIEC